MSDEYWELLEAVLANREADPPRLAMADWFERNERPRRARFIRDQLEDRTETSNELWLSRGVVLRPDWAFRIMTFPHPFNIYWSRGFVSRVVCDFRTWEQVSLLAEWHHGAYSTGLRRLGGYISQFDPHPIETVVLTDREFPSRSTPWGFNRAVTQDGKLDWDGGCTSNTWPSIRFHLYTEYKGTP